MFTSFQILRFRKNVKVIEYYRRKLRSDSISTGYTCLHDEVVVNSDRSETNLSKKGAVFIGWDSLSLLFLLEVGLFLNVIVFLCYFIYIEKLSNTLVTQ